MFLKKKRFIPFAFILVLLVIIAPVLTSSQGPLKLPVAFASSNWHNLNASTSFFPSPQPVWQRLDYPTLPSGRIGSSLAYNPLNQIALLFGGYNSTSGLLNELWLTNGHDWLQFITPHSPPGRSGANLVYDEARQGAVLFGGANDSALFGDTWFFNGIDWIEQNPAVFSFPAPGSQHGLRC